MSYITNPINVINSRFVNYDNTYFYLFGYIKTFPIDQSRRGGVACYRLSDLSLVYQNYASIYFDFITGQNGKK